MPEIRLIINGREIRVPEGTTLLEAARGEGIYIPALCHHPDLPPARDARASSIVYQGGQRLENTKPGGRGKECGLCLVEVEGREGLVNSCSTPAEDGMAVVTDSGRVRAARQENLQTILAGHPHACLTCSQQDGCARVTCSADVPEKERCCPKFGLCELQDAARAIGIPESTPQWVPTDFPVLDGDPLMIRDANLCIGCTRCVRACRDLRGVEALGFVLDTEGRVRVGTLAPTLEESGCRLCTACVEVCPTGALRDKKKGTGRREQELVPCREACPVHMDIPEYLRRIAQGRSGEALSIIRETVPLPGVLGRVCGRPCEAVCRRGEVNEPVAICALKRHAADSATGSRARDLHAAPATGKKAAVIGAGPAGLTAAFYLKMGGHAVTVFDSHEEPGGMLRYGIPSYRLPRAVLDREIRDILDLGVDFVPNRTLGGDIHLRDLADQGFDAVFLGTGAWRGRCIPLQGADHEDVLLGLDFLESIEQGRAPRLKERVLVIGGGNAAVDAALSALRRGAKDVTLACLEGRGSMPAHDLGVQRLEAEGVRLMTSRGPGKFLVEGGVLRGAEMIRCTSVLDREGRFSPTYDESTVETVKADQVILAVGQDPDLSFLETEKTVCTVNGRLEVDPDTLETGTRGVYAGGDVISNHGSVVHAVAEGRRAAAAMDRALGGTGEVFEAAASREKPDPRIGRAEGFLAMTREPVPETDPKERVRGFSEIARGYDEHAAQREASRCLQCDLRLAMGRNPSPPVERLPLDEETIGRVPETEGVYQLMDGESNVLVIRGTPNLRAALLEELGDNAGAAFFEFEEERMYSRRENELIQRYLREHGRMPSGGYDDLF